MLAVIAMTLAIPSSLCAPKATPRLYRDFVAACTEAFDRSSGNGSSGVGRQICECTAKESRHEGATPAAIASETAKIKADSKYQLQDRKLLNALHYCAIELLHDT